MIGIFHYLKKPLIRNIRNIRNSSSLNIFRKSILKFMTPSTNSLFNCHNPKGIKLITRLRLGLSHLREHKFKHSFQDSLNPFCSCGFVLPVLFLRICLIPGYLYSFRYPVIVSFNFTVYDIIYIYIYIKKPFWSNRICQN